jgi:hypothetical protein
VVWEDGGGNPASYPIGQILFSWIKTKMAIQKRFRTNKQQGEWAELLFMTRAVERGFSRQAMGRVAAL